MCATVWQHHAVAQLSGLHVAVSALHKLYQCACTILLLTAALAVAPAVAVAA
jgi:hypothetical protein